MFDWLFSLFGGGNNDEEENEQQEYDYGDSEEYNRQMEELYKQMKKDEEDGKFIG